MKKTAAALISAVLLLSGCNTVHNVETTNNEFTQQNPSIDMKDKDGKMIKITIGETFQEVIEKMGFEYNKTFEEMDTIELATLEPNNSGCSVRFENFRVGHETIDNGYAVDLHYKTKEKKITLGFNMAFSDIKVSEMKLENVVEEDN